MFTISPTQPADQPEIENLLDAVFGLGRESKTSYRFREGVDPVHELTFVVREDDRILGSIAYWPVVVGNAAVPALLLGPLAVDPARTNQGIGAALVFGTLEKAVQLGHRLVLLVGDPAYYIRFGFTGATAAGIHMPDEDPERLQHRVLDGAIPDQARGAVLPWPAAGRFGRRKLS